MIHHIFDADLRHLQNREQIRTNLTCMQPALVGADSVSQGFGYLMDDNAHQDIPLVPGRKCEDGTCCEACSRNIFPTFATPAECSLQNFPGLETFTFNNIERVPAGTIIQFVRLIERVRRMMAYEYGLDLATILPLQTYSRKYVAGQSQSGGGGSEGDSVILHTDESTHTSYHYSCVLYLNTQGEDFEGGDFIFNDPKEGYVEPPRTDDEDESESGYGNEPGVSLAEEMERARNAKRSLVRFHPSKGAGVIFSSGWENMHEVEKLTSGTRYAVPSFFTTSPVPEMAYTMMVQGKPKVRSSESSISPLPAPSPFPTCDSLRSSPHALLSPMRTSPTTGCTCSLPTVTKSQPSLWAASRSC